uniref:Uncharacterized protein n=1 Tax=Arundo donax TaxID=35708 RepID=A0A0A9DDG3_ARUDO
MSVTPYSPSPKTSSGSLSSSSYTNAISPADTAVYSSHPSYLTRSSVKSPPPGCEWFLHSHSSKRLQATYAWCRTVSVKQASSSHSASRQRELVREAPEGGGDENGGLLAATTPPSLCTPRVQAGSTARSQSASQP